MLTKIIKKCNELKWLTYSDTSRFAANEYPAYSKHLSRKEIYKNLPIIYAYETRVQIKSINGIKSDNFIHHYFINLYIYQS